MSDRPDPRENPLVQDSRDCGFRLRAGIPASFPTPAAARSRQRYLAALPGFEDAREESVDTLSRDPGRRWTTAGGSNEYLFALCNRPRIRLRHSCAVGEVVMGEIYPFATPIPISGAGGADAEDRCEPPNHTCERADGYLAADPGRARAPDG